MTVAEIPPTATRPAPPVSGAIPSEIGAEAPAPSSIVDPLPTGAPLPPAPDIAPAAIEAPPPSPTPAEIAAAKVEKDRLAKEAAAAKKAEAARIAEAKRQQQLAAAKPPAPPVETPAPPVAATPAETPAAAPPRTDASGRPTLIMPPAFDLPTPSTAAAPAAVPPSSSVATVPSPAPSSTRSEVVPDETAAAAPAASTGGGQFVVQIGAYNSAEDAAATGKRIENAYSGALGGASLEIRQTEIKGATKYRLRATGYQNRNAAANACNRLKAAGQQCFVAAR
jgi:hypothetical protein